MVVTPGSLVTLPPEVSVLPRPPQVQTPGPFKRSIDARSLRESFTLRFISPQGREAHQGSLKVVKLQEVLDTLHLIPVVVILRKNLYKVAG